MSVVVDTSAVAPEERFALWADATPRVFEPLAVQRQATGPFHGEVHGWDAGPFTLYRLVSDATLVRRTPRLIGASDPEWLQLSLVLSGCCVVEQDGRRSLLRTGDVACWASSRPYAIDARTAHDLLVAYLPAEALPGVRTAAPLPGTALVRRYMRRLLRDARTGEAFHADVAGGLLEVASGTGALPRAPAAQRALVHGFIDEHLGDPALTPEAIAAAHHMSRRRLDRLFAGAGRTVAETIRDRRLERCRADLQDPALAGESILAIASRWGFVSPAHFSRTFRAAYGMSPREARMT
jgi:AraC-like DNA-binding protein